MIVGLSGRAGSGKNVAADALVEHRGFACCAFADPMKRICAEVFAWDADRLWGPSERRNEPDPAWDGLTARRALQELGMAGRSMHPDVWVRATMREIAKRPDRDHVISDVRFKNEAAAILAAGGSILRIVRPGLDRPAFADHVSETELTDDDGRMIAIVNAGTKDELSRHVRRHIDALRF